MKTGGKRNIGLVLGAAALCALAGNGLAAEKPGAQASAAQAAPAPANDLPMVPPAKPGVFTATKKGATGYHLVVAGHKFTSRDDIEKYLAWRAADLTLSDKGSWFTFTPARAKTDAVALPKRDPAAPRHSFQMANFKPVWRYKIKGGEWKSWSPYSGAAFFADSVKAEDISDFEASADIVVRKGVMDDADPLGYEAGAVSDLLINQVSPPV
jgi:hypothetical protein